MAFSQVTKPILILAFNRPSHVRNLIDSLRPQRPKKILISLDGPRRGNKFDVEKIAQVLEEIKKINWTTDVEILKHERNLGLRFAVVEAVSWVIDKYGEVIVIEDDVVVGPEFCNFMSEMLDSHKDDEKIGHVSGYTLVPKPYIENYEECCRLSTIPVSYAWATWARAWKLYDPEMNWAKSQSVVDLKKRLGRWTWALIWKINFFDASRENISTWAYRWLATLWQNELFCIEPNRNLVSYMGHRDGTHTRTKVKFQELEIEDLPKRKRSTGYYPKADSWLQKNTFRGTRLGLMRRVLESLILNLIRICKF